MDTRSTPAFDVFISHASEDKGRFVDALDTALRERGVTCWYDARAIQLGDDFRRRMDEGLSRRTWPSTVPWFCQTSMLRSAAVNTTPQREFWDGHPVDGGDAWVRWSRGAGDNEMPQM